MTGVTPTDLLAGVDLFAELRPDELTRLADASSRENLRRGDIIFREDDEPDRLYVVVQGRIAISKRSIDGRESVVALMEEGELASEAVMRYLDRASDLVFAMARFADVDDPELFEGREAGDGDG